MTSQSTVKETRTIITSSSAGGQSGSDSGGGDDFYYRSSIAPRRSDVGHTSSISSVLGAPQTTGGGGFKKVVEITSGMLPSGYANVSHTGVINVKTHREQEKKDMQNLNERFANYIDKVRFLEAQNKKLTTELEDLRSHWGKETTAIKKMYETELAEARKMIEDITKEKNKLEVRLQSMQDAMDDAHRQLDEAKKWRAQDRETINKLNQQLSELEAEIRMLRRSNEAMETERARDKGTIAKLQEELEKLRIDLSNETIARLDAENKYQTLLEELQFLKDVHEQELKELSALAYRDTTAENREFWKNELAQAIRDMQQEYDLKVDQIRGEMESFYNLKVQEFRTGATKQNMEVAHSREETKKLQKQLSDARGRMSDLEARNALLERQYQDLMRELEMKEHDHDAETNSLREEMNKLRADMEGMLVELQTLMDAKLSLELEIAAYRKLLECEETRIPLHHSVWNPYRNSLDGFNKSTRSKSSTPHNIASTSCTSSSPKRQISNRTSSRPPSTSTITATATLKDQEPKRGIDSKTKIVYDVDDDSNREDDYNDDDDTVFLRRPGEKGTLRGCGDEEIEARVSDHTNPTVVVNSNTVDENDEANNCKDNDGIDDKMVVASSTTVHCEPEIKEQCSIEPEIKTDVSQCSESVPINSAKSNIDTIVDNSNVELRGKNGIQPLEENDNLDSKRNNEDKTNDNVKSCDPNDYDDGDDIGITLQTFDEEEIDRVNEDGGEALAYETLDQSATSEQNKNENEIGSEGKDDSPQQISTAEQDLSVPEKSDQSDVADSFKISVVEDVMTVEKISSVEMCPRNSHFQDSEQDDLTDRETIKEEDKQSHVIDGNEEEKNMIIDEQEKDSHSLMMKEIEKKPVESSTENVVEPLGLRKTQEVSEKSIIIDDADSHSPCIDKAENKETGKSSGFESEFKLSTVEKSDVEIAKQVVQSVLEESVSSSTIAGTKPCSLSSPSLTEAKDSGVVTEVKYQMTRKEQDNFTKIEEVMNSEEKVIEKNGYETSAKIEIGRTISIQDINTNIKEPNAAANQDCYADKSAHSKSIDDSILGVDYQVQTIEKNESCSKDEKEDPNQDEEVVKDEENTSRGKLQTRTDSRGPQARNEATAPEIVLKTEALEVKSHTEENPFDVKSKMEADAAEIKSQTEAITPEVQLNINVVNHGVHSETEASIESKSQTKAVTPEIKPQRELIIPGTKLQTEKNSPEAKQQTEAITPEVISKIEPVTPEAKQQTESVLTEAKQKTESVTPEAKPQMEAVTLEAKPRTEAVTLETKLHTEEIIPEIELQTETVTSEAKSETEAVTHEVISKTEVVPPNAISQTEAVTPEVIFQTEAVTPEVMSKTEVFTPDAMSQTEAVTPEVISQTEVVTPEVESQTEAVTPEVIPQTEAVTPEAKPKTDAVTPETITTEVELEAEPITRELKKPQMEAVTPEAKPRTEVFTLETKLQTEEIIPEVKVVTSEAKSETEAVTPEITSKTEVVTPDAISQTQAVTPEVVSKTEIVTPGVIAQTEAVTPEAKPDPDAVTTEVISQSEAVTPEVISQTESVLPEAKLKTEAVTPEIISQSEAVTPKVISQTESVLPETKPKIEAVTPDVKQQSEAATPEAKPLSEAVTVEAKPETKEVATEVKSETSRVMTTNEVISQKVITTEAKLKSEVVSQEITYESISSKVKSEAEPDTLEAKSEMGPVAPEVKSEQEPIIPETKSGKETITPEVKSKEEPITHELKSEKEPITPEVKSEKEPINPEEKHQAEEIPERKSETGSTTSEVKSDTKIVTPETKAETEEVTHEVKSETSSSPGVKSEIETVNFEVKLETHSVSEIESGSFDSSIEKVTRKTQINTDATHKISSGTGEIISQFHLKTESKPEQEELTSNPQSELNSAKETYERKDDALGVYKKTEVTHADNRQSLEGPHAETANSKVKELSEKSSKNEDVSAPTQTSEVSYHVSNTVKTNHDTAFTKGSVFAKNEKFVSSGDKTYTEIEEEEYLLGDGACEDLVETSSRETSLVEPSREAEMDIAEAEIKKECRTDDTDDDGLDDNDILDDGGKDVVNDHKEESHVHASTVNGLSGESVSVTVTSEGAVDTLKPNSLSKSFKEDIERGPNRETEALSMSSGGDKISGPDDVNYVSRTFVEEITLASKATGGIESQIIQTTQIENVGIKDTETDTSVERDDVQGNSLTSHTESEVATGKSTILLEQNNGAKCGTDLTQSSNSFLRDDTNVANREGITANNDYKDRPDSDPQPGFLFKSSDTEGPDKSETQGAVVTVVYKEVTVSESTISTQETTKVSSPSSSSDLKYEVQAETKTTFYQEDNRSELNTFLNDGKIAGDVVITSESGGEETITQKEDIKEVKLEESPATKIDNSKEVHVDSSLTYQTEEKHDDLIINGDQT